MGTITQQHLDKAISYAKFRERVEELHKEGKTTSGETSKQMLHYTKLNLQRMNRVEKQTVLLPDLKQRLVNLKHSMIWVVLTEGWCGDVAQSLPAMAKMAVASPKISLRILYRDENPDVMDAYLTNGARSIPKLICLDEQTLEEKWTWGPRPDEAQQVLQKLKNEGELSTEQIYATVQEWYNEDKNYMIQKEILELLEKEDQQVEAG